MSFENPTSLRIGMTGTVAGKSYRVVGRVVMGVEEAGQTYYWNEFNLQADDGEFARWFSRKPNAAESGGCSPCSNRNIR
jgi:hypothetical protein